MQAPSGPSHLRAADPGGQLGLQNFPGPAGGSDRGEGLRACVSPHGGLQGTQGPLPDRGGLPLTYEEGSMASHSGQTGATCTQMSMGCGRTSSVLGLGPCSKS